MHRRVAVVYHFFAHYREAIIRELIEDGRHDWTFVGDATDFGSDIKPATFPDGARFIRLKTVPIIRNVIWQRGIIRIAASKDYDTLVLLGVSKYLSMWAAALVGRATGKRVIFWTHGWTYRPTGVLRYVRRWFYKLAHVLMTYGHWAKQIGIEEGFAPELIHRIGNSLDLDAQNRALSAIPASRRSEVRRELFGDDSLPVVACSSRLTAVRRLDMLLDAVARLRAEGLRCRVILIGEGSARADLEALTRKLNLEVAFIGACYDERRIGELLLASNVTVAPGKVGLTAMHSMAFGIPVVSHGNPENQMPEYESIIPGKTGSFFEDGNVDSLAAAIRPWVARQWASDVTGGYCRDVIRRFWSPRKQRDAIYRAIEGLPADDLYWVRE
jgi:glycosyltransferase involved in cell wall biosynthesis